MSGLLRKRIERLENQDINGAELLRLAKLTREQLLAKLEDLDATRRIVIALIRANAILARAKKTRNAPKR